MSTSTRNAGRFEATATEAAQHFVLKEAYPPIHRDLVSHIETLWRAPTCEMLECTDCNLSFAHPFVAGDSEFYRLAYPHPDYPKDKWEFAATVEALSKLPTAGKRGLELGSGFGYFLNKISPKFFPRDHITALEYNEISGDNLRKAGFNVIAQDIRSAGFDDKQGHFDFVFMFQVLEHMDELNALAERLHYVTKPGANIFIAVPNPERIKFNEENGALLDMPPNHITRWSKDSLIRFGERIGCEVVDFQVEPTTWKEFVREDLIYRYLRRAQQPGTIANRVHSRPKSSARRAVEAALVLTGAPARAPGWMRAMNHVESMGASLWIQLKRI